MTGLAPRLAVAAALTVTALLSGGCAEQPVSGAVLVLTLATPDRETEDTSVPIKHFADEVERLSRGAIVVKPAFWVAPPGASGWDQYTARAVAAGDYDLGLVPSRAFDSLGVDSLRALNTPFLIQSEDAVEAVLRDGVRRDLMAGLPAAGLVGLDLFPAGLRHPFGYDRPLLGAEDYAGGTFRIALSETVEQLFAALDARVTDTQASSAQRGAESAYAWTPGGIATGNVTFFPKITTLVAVDDLRERLRPDQWNLLGRAAASTRSWMYGAQPSDLEDAVAYCAGNGKIVGASPDQVESLHDAAAPVVSALESDGDTGPIIERIRSLIEGLPEPEPLDSCPEGVVASPTAPASPGDAELARLDGIYYTRVTRRELRTAGVTDDQTVTEETGRFMWTLNRGEYTFHQETVSYVDGVDGSGRYTFRDDVFTLTWPDGSTTRARVRVGGDGSLHFTDVVDSLDQALGEGTFLPGPWVRIGDLPSASA